MEHSYAKTVPKPATNCIKEETDFYLRFFLQQHSLDSPKIATIIVVIVILKDAFI